MSTVKITELPLISALNSDTTKTLFLGVDTVADYTGKMTVSTLAKGLYSNNTLAVGNNYTILPNVVGQFSANSESYIQLNLQNQKGNGSADIVVTADSGDDANYYIDLGLNGSTYNFPGYTYASKLDGYLVVQGSASNAALPGGNLVMGTTTAGKSISILQGTTDASGIVAQFVANTGFKLLKKPLYFADGTSQNTAVDYTTINSYINTRISSNVSVLNANISAVNNTAQAAFTTANNALANTTGTFAGTLSITRDLNVNGTVTLSNSNFSNTQAAMTIKATSNTQTPSNDGYMLHISGKQGIPSRIVFDSYGSGAYGLVAGRSARGTVDSPSASQNNDVLMRVSGNGWGTTGFNPLGVARMDIIATENYTDSSRGSKIVFYNIPNGSNTVQEIASLNADHVDFSGVVSPAKGFIYTPRILTGAQTAITINFATDAMVRATFSSTLTMSFSNYTQGKIVEAWVTNTAGTGQTINLGVQANNSTTGSATLSVASQRSAKLQYFSIDGDLANTFVAVTYG